MWIVTGPFDNAVISCVYFNGQKTRVLIQVVTESKLLKTGTTYGLGRKGHKQQLVIDNGKISKEHLTLITGLMPQEDVVSLCDPGTDIIQMDMHYRETQQQQHLHSRYI